MKMIIFTMGTRGDVQPYIYLAHALMKAGHEVTIGTHPCWKDLVETAGVGFCPIGPDIDISIEAAIIRGKNKNPMMSLLKTMNFIFKIIQNSSGDIYAASEGKDFMIVSHSHMGAIEALALNIPFIDVTLQTEALPDRTKKSTWFGRMMGNMIGSFIMKPYNKIRKIYHMPKVHDMDCCMSKELNLIPISKEVVPQNPGWDPKNKVVGYWYEEENYEPDEALKEFLAAGDPPVILALGAMSFESETQREKLNLFVQAFKETKMRALIQGFSKTLEDYELPEGMMAIGSIPHCWLFKQGYLVFHHCGFGTASASMLYEIPSIAVPHALDQFGIAQTMEKLGVCGKPLDAGKLSKEAVVDAILECKEQYESRKAVLVQLSAKMKAEDGLNTSVRLIEEVIAHSENVKKNA